MSSIGPLVPFILILAVFWLLVLRPQQRRQRELRALQSSLTTGSEVMLTSGIFGTVSGSTDDHILVDVAPGVTLRVVRGAVAQVISPAETEPEPETATERRDGDEPEQIDPVRSEEN